MRSYIVSLSTIPPRFGKLPQTLAALRRQSVAPETIIVYVPEKYRRFPDWDGTLPEVPEGVEIRRVKEDFGPATKLLPALRDFAGQDVDILFCDDDMAYPRHWASWFLRQRARQPEACIALCGGDLEGVAVEDRPNAPQPRPLRWWRITDPEAYIREAIEGIGQRWLGWPQRYLGRRMYLTAGFMDTFHGYGGVMVKPHFYDETVFDIPKQVWAVDDYWLSANAVKNGHPVWIIPFRREPNSFPYYVEGALTTSVVDGQGRDDANAFAEHYLRERFGIWK